jgi:hypothetical protein
VRTARIGQPERTDRTGQEGSDRQNGTGRKGQAEWDRQDETGGTGQAERDRQNGTGRTEQAEQDRQNGTGRTEQAEQDRQSRKPEDDSQDRQDGQSTFVRKGMPKQDCQDRSARTAMTGGTGSTGKCKAGQAERDMQNRPGQAEQCIIQYTRIVNFLLRISLLIDCETHN